MEDTGDEMARYLAGMCEQLAKLAEQSGFDIGAYLLRMTYLEFADVQRKPDRTPQDDASIG